MTLDEIIEQKAKCVTGTLCTKEAPDLYREEEYYKQGFKEALPLDFAVWISKNNWKIQGESNKTWRKGYSATDRFKTTEELYIEFLESRK